MAASLALGHGAVPVPLAVGELDALPAPPLPPAAAAA
jgi:hypothetical protein